MSISKNPSIQSITSKDRVKINPINQRNFYHPKFLYIFNSFFQNISSTSISILVLILITFIHLASIYVFSQGFLLSRITLNDHSSFQSNSNLLKINQTHSKAIIILIDALRFDFILPHTKNLTLIDPLIHNQLILPHQLSKSNPNHSLLFHFLADPPTTTLQRLKALTTGTLPTFIDISSNFASTNVAIDEDNWLTQLHLNQKQIGLIGDDTWIKLFGIDSKLNQNHLSNGLFNPNLTFPFESFNVEDLDTVDDGVQKHLIDILSINQTLQNSHWDVLIGHLLGLDHAGHRFGASHPTIKSKLNQYNQLLTKIVNHLDDQTLLIVMGDHGMDSKGDHGGDSFNELSTALWLYSKSKPLINQQEDLPNWLFDKNDFINLQPSIGITRTISQIDLVPTLSLLLGIPIPFSNLGLIIPELFFHSNLAYNLTSTHPSKPQNLSALENLLLSISINSNQLFQFLERYAGSPNSPGQDLALHLPLLRQLYNQTIQSSQLQNHQDTFKAHRTFGLSLLSISRKIWSKFIPSLMSLGIIILTLSLLVSWKLINCLKFTTLNPNAPIRTALSSGLSIGFGGTALSSLIHFTNLLPHINFLSFILIGSSLGISIGIIFHQPISFKPNDPSISFTIPSFKTFLQISPLIFHALIFASNSFTIWEDRIVGYLAFSGILFSALMTSFTAPQKRLRIRLFLFSILFAICLRSISLSTVCREEQQKSCLVTFYSNSTSSSPPNWVMSILIPLAIVLPIILAWFLGISDSYRGPASFYFGTGFRLLLLCAVQYWITDYIISEGDLSANPNVKSTGTWMKTLAARINILLGLFSAGLLWFILPLCIDVEHQGKDEKNQVQEEEKERVLVIGFANSYGSSYLMYLCALFGILFLVNQPMGEIVLSAGLVAILSLVEINDSLEDVQALEQSFQNAINKAARAQSSISPSVMTFRGTNLAIIISLNLLGHLLFFGTGHQATFASIQWKTAFIGLDSAHKLFSGLLIILNTFGGFILIGLSIPLLTLWNVSPRIGKEDNQLNLISKTLDSSIKLMSVQACLGLSSMISCSVLRRHLMVWKIFGPRFLLSSLIILISDLILSLFSVGFGLSLVVFKVKKSFGTKCF
ncbi:hypothetical protein O181_056186 [Austropuccinia psidii MF-1]|uniref:GPI ethanolamine phosphate transferase 2 C-terminal domain-containing protein n=1 Tax=Austropuccinia psidii MF-1 TaxID=1389203 RepID=A0A9Q3ECS4_9BASI|nr:hypothetical protein [Austropuccinia psidii MF-1]